MCFRVRIRNSLPQRQSSMFNNPHDNPIYRVAENFGFSINDDGTLKPPSTHVLESRRKEAELAKNRSLREFMEDVVLPLIKDNHDACVAVAIVLKHFSELSKCRFNSVADLMRMLPDDIEKEKRIARCEGVRGVLDDSIHELEACTLSLPSGAVNESLARLAVHIVEQS